MPIHRDWRDPEDYAFTYGLNFLGWAWEFLRRNPEYKQDHALATGSAKDKKEFYEVNYEYPDMADFEICELKWGLQEFIDPEDDNPDIDVARVPGVAKYGVSHSVGSIQEDSMKINVVWYRFDLDYSIPGQLKKARYELEAIKRARQKVLGDMSGTNVDFFERTQVLHTQKETWSVYLRVLDAEFAYKFKNDGSLLKKDLAQSIFPEQTNEYPVFTADDRYKKTLSAAERMMTQEFKQLLTSY